MKESHLFQQQTHRLMKLLLLMYGCCYTKIKPLVHSLDAERGQVLGKLYTRTAAVLD